MLAEWLCGAVSAATYGALVVPDLFIADTEPYSTIPASLL